MPPNGSQVRASYIWIMIAFNSAIFLGTLLAATGKGEDLRFVFLADSRNDAIFINIAALNHINSQIVSLLPKPSFVIFGGDMANYGFKTDGSDNFQAFKNAMETVTKGVSSFM
jgi:hypothetical protein